MQFVAWLVYELNKRGENLPPNPNYADLMLATQRHLPQQRDAA